MRGSVLAITLAAVAPAFAAPALVVREPAVRPVLPVRLPPTRGGNGGNAYTGNSGPANGGSVMQQSSDTGFIFNTQGSGK